VLLFNGQEMVRRPWRMFAQNMGQQSPDLAQRPVAFTGIVPTSPELGPVDDGLRKLLATIGHTPGTLEVKIVGDDASVIADGSYDVSQSPIGDAAVVGAALQQAEAAAKTPTACRKVGP
jgi:hypothetical protein